ncbi:carbohydrate porin [Paraburkholderia nemoris]|uniref:carbohydrate porin n=1 Tax=Paraburkholderia nemoris TaxID=2793076 RepID=UPI0038B92495
MPHWFAATTSPSNIKAIALACLLTATGTSECMADTRGQVNTPASDAQAPANTHAPNASLAQAGQAPAVPAPEGLPPMGNMDCAKYDKYNTRIMSTIYLPSVCDTVAPKLFGFRDFLADHGWGFQASTSPVAEYDVLNGHRGGAQHYAGQTPSAYDITSVYVTYDLSRIGFPEGGQLTGSASNIFSNGRTGEAPVLHPAMTTLGIVQPLFGNTLELKAGYLLTIQDFVGMNLTGNAGSAAQGLSSVIPALAGLSVYTPTPTAEITVRDPWTKNFYNHFGISRSVSPDGSLVELAENPTGFRWHTPGTKALFIDEVGYKTGMTQDSLPVWARAGFIYNTTNYTKFNGQVANNNYAFYAGLTVQLTKNSYNPGGLNLDIKVDAAPSDRNFFAKDYSINLFWVGPFASRPFDMVSLGFSQTFESRDLQAIEAAHGVQNTSAISTDVSVSYSYRVRPGIYLISTASLVTNPGTVMAPKLPTALIVNEKIIFSF